MFDVLKKANFNWDSDELYILGDIIDRGPHSAEALHWIIDEAPNNVHFLLGNHEDMAYKSLSIITDNSSIDSHIFEDPWSWNGGRKTLKKCRDLYGMDWCHKAAKWISELPLYYIVDDKLLVHAGLCNGEILTSDEFIETGCQGYVSIPNIEKLQWSQHLLWIRSRWLYSQENYPYDIIFGHTPTSCNWMKGMSFPPIEPNINIKYYGKPNDIVRIEGFSNNKIRYCIDTGRQRMGLLRLDDYAEFYSELKEEE